MLKKVSQGLYHETETKNDLAGLGGLRHFRLLFVMYLIEIMKLTVL